MLILVPFVSSLIPRGTRSADLIEPTLFYAGQIRVFTHLQSFLLSLIKANPGLPTASPLVVTELTAPLTGILLA